MLVVEDPRIVCVTVVFFSVPELPGDAELLASGCVEEVAGLVDETSCSIATEKIAKIEAAA